MVRGNMQSDPKTDAFEQYSLYNKEIEQFFLEKYIAKKTYSRGELIDNWTNNSVAYIHTGYCKLYLSNANGDEMFNGFIPQYSILFSTPGLRTLGKYSLANVDNTVIYVAALSDYLAFLQDNPACILHQMYEPYYRRNFNDLPHYETINQNARLKVYAYIRYVVLRFGKRSAVNEYSFIMQNPPTNKDIAHYNDIHPNNVITYFNDLKRQGIVHKTKDKLTIADIRMLEKEIELLRK